MLRILIDMQGCQTDGRYCGRGRYADELAQALIANSQGNAIHILLNGSLAASCTEIVQRFEPIIAPSNIHIIEIPQDKAVDADAWPRMAGALLREAYIDYISPDLVICPIVGLDAAENSVVSIGHFSLVPVVAGMYESLSPIKESKSEPDLASFNDFLKRIEQEVRRARGVIVGSERGLITARDALKFDVSCIIEAGLQASSHFYPSAPAETQAQALLTRCGITRDFLFCTGAGEYRANLSSLVQAYAILPLELRKAYQLVVSGPLSAALKTEMRECAYLHGLQATDLVLVDRASIEDLAALYNLAHACVFPAMHEDDSLPIFEALVCATPVICAQTGTSAKLVGTGKVLFNANSVGAISAKIRQVLKDKDLRDKLAGMATANAQAYAGRFDVNRIFDGIRTLVGPPADLDQDWPAIINRLDATDDRLLQALAALSDPHPGRGNGDVLRLAQAMSNNRVRAEQHLRVPLPEGPLTWRLEGPFDSSYSLALVNRELARALVELGHDVSLLSSEGPGDFPASPAFLAQNDDLAQLYRRALNQHARAAHVTSRNMYPPRVFDMVSLANTLHSYGWEESGFPLEHVLAFNESLQFLTVMAEHVKKIMIDNGVSVPIAVAGIGVDHWTRVQADKDYVLTAPGVRLLHVSSCFPRKGVDVMLESYGMAFTSADDVTLIIKTFDNPHNTVDQMLVGMHQRFPSYPRVQVIKEDYTAEQIKALYEQCHVLVAPSRAEGFGLPMAEGMLSGLHVITTGWSGQLDFCDSAYCDLIDYSFSIAKTHEGTSDSVWAEPDPVHLATLMKQACTKAREPGAVRPTAPPALLERFSWRAVAQRNVDAARALTALPPVRQPRVAWVSTYNTRCGVATYSEHMVSVLGMPVTVLAMHAQQLVRPDEANVLRSWSLGQETDDELQSTIERHDFDVVVIQFAYGFYDFVKLNNMLHALADQGRSVIVTFHATIDPPNNPSKALTIMASGLARCARLLVHSVGDMNRFKSYGLHHNAVLVPHGVLLPDLLERNLARLEQARFALSSTHPLVIASYGFFLPNKGLLELIQAAAMLEARGIDLCLRLVNAEYPVHDSPEIIARAQALVRELGMVDNVTFNTAFLSDEESLALLSEADVIVFPYQQTGESASGAVRYGVATGIPVAVTPLSIFDDVDAAVFRLPGISPEHIAEGLQRLAGQLRDWSPEVRRKAQAAQAWRNGHAYPTLGRRLRGMIEGLHRNKHMA